MRGAGFIEVDRDNRRRAIRALITARQRLDASMSLWIAPEGRVEQNRTSWRVRTGWFSTGHGQRHADSPRYD